MNVLLVLSHPERRSFNGGLTDVAVSVLSAQGHHVEVDDLYAEDFDPIERPELYADPVNTDYFSALTEQRAQYAQGALTPDIRREIDRLQWADLTIFQFPLWWHALPAMLKGWFDRVFVYGGIYTGSQRYDRGYFRGKRAMLSVTTGSPESAFMPWGRAGDMTRLLAPMHASLNYVGYSVLAPQLSYGVQGGGISYQDQAAFERHLERLKDDWASRLSQIEGDERIRFAGWDDWDEQGVLKQRHPLRWQI